MFEINTNNLILPPGGLYVYYKVQKVQSTKYRNYKVQKVQTGKKVRKIGGKVWGHSPNLGAKHLVWEQRYQTPLRRS